mmetsp:Transcript_6517/g.27735  ORF Transcript_6517/g.27735 Transcript_6517/m.27735 type:complete len:168 (+) Transcript_6517:3109-3612(+)
MDSLGNYRLGRFRLFLMPPSWRPTLGTRVIAYTTIAMYLWILLPFIIGGRASRLLQLCFLFVLLNIIASSLLLLRAACTDPGIVLRSRSPPADAERFRLKNGRYPRSKPATVNGVNTHAWFCGKLFPLMKKPLECARFAFRLSIVSLLVCRNLSEMDSSERIPLQDL